jgi:hypothetical protein
MGRSYKVIAAENVPELENKVQEWITKGWSPMGAPFPVVYPRPDFGDARVTFYQAVTKEPKA